MTKKYTITEIISVWAADYDEDMMTEYTGFIRRLSEENASQASDPGEGSDTNNLGARTK